MYYLRITTETRKLIDVTNNYRKMHNYPILRKKAMKRARKLYKPLIITHDKSLPFEVDKPDFGMMHRLHVYGASVIQPPKVLIKHTNA